MSSSKENKSHKRTAPTSVGAARGKARKTYRLSVVFHACANIWCIRESGREYIVIDDDGVAVAGSQGGPPGGAPIERYLPFCPHVLTGSVLEKNGVISHASSSTK